MRHSHGHPTPSVQRARERFDARFLKDGTTGRVLGDNVDLNVPLDDLDDGAVEIHEDLPTAFVSSMLDDGQNVRWRARAPSRVDVTLDKEAGFVRVTGSARFSLLHPCVRCLNDVPFEVPLEVDLRLVQREKPLQIDDEEESQGFGDDDAPEATDLEDLDVASFSDGIVAMGDVLREQLFLELPMHPACDSPRARPTGPCSFVEPRSDPQWVESRWAGLAALRDKLPPGPNASPSPAAKAAPTTAAPKGATSKKAAPKKPAPKKAAPKKAAAQKAAVKKAAVKKAAPRKTAPKKSAPKKGAAKKASAPKKKAGRKPTR